MRERIPPALETASQHGSGPEIPESLKGAVIDEQLEEGRRRAENSGCLVFLAPLAPLLMQVLANLKNLKN